MSKPKIHRHGVLDLNGPTVILFTDDFKEATAKADESDSYVAIDMHAHSKKPVRKKPFIKPRPGAPTPDDTPAA